MTQDSLLPCPFCSSTDVKPRNDDVAYLPPATRYVLCRGFGASGANVETEAEAIAAWNRRAPDAALEALADALKYALYNIEGIIYETDIPSTVVLRNGRAALSLYRQRSKT